MKSGVLKDLIESLGSNKEIIPIEQVTGSVLKKCMDFCDSKRDHDKLTAWHRRFFDVDRAILFGKAVNLLTYVPKKCFRNRHSR